MEPIRVPLELDDLDNQILTSVCQRLRCTKADALRWSLRWYAISGPWRQPNDPLLPPCEGQQHRLTVGPREERVVL